MNAHYPKVAERAGHRCEYCHAPEKAFNFPFEVEHITPLAAHGIETMDNLALSCRSCNAFKSFRRAGVDPETLARVSLYHPRKDAWASHFRIEAETLLLEGVTEIGRGTIAALQMNSPAQIQARRQWRRLELFP